MQSSPFALPSFDIHSLIRDLAGFVMIKDLHSNYLNANLNTINEFNLQHAENLLGYSDLTIPHPLSQNGQLYRKLDLEVIQSGESLKGICTFPFEGHIRPYLFRKSLLKDLRGENIATYSQAEICTDPALIQFIQFLFASNPVKKVDNNNFILNKAYPDITLSSVESVCLFYLIRKKSKTDIARLLQVPSKQIDMYINNIKVQLQVNHLRDLMEIAIQKDYFNIVPAEIFAAFSHRSNKQLNNQLLGFTKRELDCANLLIRKHKVKEIAAKMQVSPRTVETHLNNIKMKLNCSDKMELIIKLKEKIL